MRKKELLARLAEREAHIAQLEQRVQTMDGLIDGYHSREAAIVSALTHAHETAAEVIADAETRAKRILDDAGAAAESLRATAETDAARMIEEARRQSAQLLSRTEATVAEYETAIAAYNAALERAAAEAAANAERFAAFSRGHRIGPSELRDEVQGLHEMPYAGPMELPDAAGDPAQLMRNIYRLQNRIPPEGGYSPAPEPAAEGTQEAPPAEQRDAMPASPPVEPPESAPPVEQSEGAPASPTPAPPTFVEEDGEAEPVPTVREVLPEDGAHCAPDDATLDELLEEILKAGEQYDG